jgi:signal transduction histidine kinase
VERATILVVDDMADVLETTAAVLGEAGYEVVCCGGSREALAVLSNGHAIDLLVTDIEMPEIDGFELARQAKALRPTLLVAYLTGYVPSLPDEPLGPILRKPYRRDNLVKDIKALLAAGEDARLVRAIASEMIERRADAFGQLRERERRLNEMEAILVHLSRVNELGQHVSTLIHEISQPIAAISMLAQASMRLCDVSTDRLKQSLEALVEAAANATATVQHLRGFIKSSQPDRQVQPVAAIIEDAIRLVSFGDISELAIDTRYHPAATRAFCDRVQIEQVVSNLVRNAIEAMADNTPCVLIIATGLTPEGLIQISIADTGPGLPSAVRGKLFEPFVSTKTSGLGVGLSICRVIIEAHGGQLWAEDNPGGGTIFRFTLRQRPVEVSH